MSDLYNYDFIKTLSSRSLDIIDTKTLLTYGMIGITCLVLGAATLYDEMEEEKEGEEQKEESSDSEAFEKESIDETPAQEPVSTGGKKSKKNKTKRRRR
jgi:hypothetical protein